MDEKTPPRRPSVAKLSKTPSWVMLGFILGALVVWSLPRREPPPRPIVMAPQPEKSAARSEPPQLTTVEAVFAEWSEYAIWERDVTQVALWNPAIGSFAEFYEVRRVDGVYYFRSLPNLTNRPLRHGKLPPPECPLRFSETEEQYREWRENGRFERPAEPVRPATIPPATPAPRTDVEVTPLAPPLEPSVDVRPKK